MSWNTNNSNADATKGKIEDALKKLARSLEMDRTKEVLVTASTIAVILWGVRNVGLEKTLEDLRTSISPNMPEPDQGVYDALLKFASRSKDMIGNSKDEG